MTIDLHIHSTYSDGSNSPFELVELASFHGLTALSLTDHDTIEGVDEAMEAGEKFGVEIVPGVELSVGYSDCTLHILGYYFDVNNSPLHDGLLQLQTDRVRRNEAILFRLKECGINIDTQELKTISAKGLTGRPHIAQLLIQNGVVRSMDEAFERFLGKDGKAYVSRSVYSPEQAISLIRNANGISVLAHPLQVERAGSDLSVIIKELARFGLDGVELYYPTHSKKKRKMLRQYIESNDLIATGGSDFHGTVRPGTTMAWGRKLSVPADILKDMKQRIVQR